MKIKLLFLLMIPYAILSAQQVNILQHQSSSKTDRALSDQALYEANTGLFIQNKGQWDPEVKYLARINGMNAWITNSGVVYDYYKITRKNADKKMLKMNPLELRDYENKNTSIEGNVVKMELVNSKKEITSVGNDKREGYYNYFIGNDKSKWASFVPLYNNIELQGVYKNIDVKYYYDNGTLRYDYKVKPGADISQIKFKFEGQLGISINSNGELVLNTNIGEVTNGKIFAYQIEDGSKKEIECKFEQKEDSATGLNLAGYDIKKEIIIDPLVYSTFIGGSGASDWGSSIAIDANGNAFITGQTRSSNFPATPGAYQSTIGDSANGCAFITKLNPAGTALVYSTFIGGNSGRDWGTSIAIDSAGDAYITGSAASSNFPTTNGAYQTTLHSINGNAFITKLNQTGSALIYSTFLGGSSNNGNGDQGNSIIVDINGNAYITGFTWSSNYPTTDGAYQTVYNNVDAFVTKLNSTGTALIYSTFLGGNTNDIGNSIALDASGNTYITGQTYSPDFPTTSGAFQTTLHGYYNAFVTKLNSAGSGIVYSTYIGGDSLDAGISIAIDAGKNAYLTGYTFSSNYPTTNGAYQTTFGGNTDAFVTKLNSTGGLVYSTFLGGKGYDEGSSITVDTNGSACITGDGDTGYGYPTTNGAYQTTGSGVFITKLNSIGSALEYSTIIGEGVGYSIALDRVGNAYITGSAASDYPMTIGAYQTSFGGGHADAFITKLNLSPTTFVQTDGPTIPNRFELSQNYPNPFNPTTTIRYALPYSSNVRIQIYNLLGQKVRELLNGQKNAGYYSVNFNTTGLASGIYFYFIEAKSTDGKNEFRNTKKMVLLR